MRILTFAMMLTVGAIGFVGLQFVQSDLGLDLTGAGSPEQIIARLGESEAALSKVYENLDGMTAEDAVEKAVAQLKQVDSNYESLGNHELETDTERTAQMSVMRSYYLAQSMLPQYKNSFQQLANRIIDLRSETEDAAIARVLLFCSKHDLASPAKKTLLREIAKEAQSYGSAGYGVGLYSIVAHELWKHGKPKSAEKVLETGISHYKSCSEKIKLVHQMIDQGHRDPPKPKMSQTQFKRMQRALANASPATSAVKFRC